MSDRLAARSVRAWTVALTAVAALALSPAASALEQLKIMAPAAPGGGWDSTARSMQAAIQQAGIVKTVQVTNVPGAGGTVGLANLVNNQKGDGSQLMMSGLVMVGAILSNKSAVKLGQTTPIARLTGEYEMIVVPTASKLKSMADLVAELKKSPGGVSWAGGSAGGTDHILVGLVAQAVGVDPTKTNYVPHSGGGESLAAILGGHVTAGVNGIGELIGQLKAGKVRALAVSSDKRLSELPNVPTLKEQGINVELANWRGVVAPPGISDAQKKDLVAVVERMVKSPQWKATLEKQGWTDLYLAGDPFASYLTAEEKRVEGVLRSIGLVK